MRLKIILTRHHSNADLLIDSHREMTRVSAVQSRGKIRSIEIMKNID